MQACLMPAAAVASASGGACTASRSQQLALWRCSTSPTPRKWGPSLCAPHTVLAFVLVLLAVPVAHAAPNHSNHSSSSEALVVTPAVVPAHKPLQPLAATDIALFVVVALALFIASGAGVGGGVLVVPALLIISNFSSIAAVALSNFTILSSSIAAIGFNLPRRSSTRPGPLISWDLVVLMGPPIVAGSIAGSWINLVVPGWITKVLLLLLVVPMAWRMIDKARSMHARETAVRQQAAAAQAERSCPGNGSTHGPPDRSITLSSRSNSSSNSVDPEAGTCQEQAPDCSAAPGEPVCAAVQRRLQREQEALLPPLQVGLLALMVAYVAASSLLAGLLMTCGTWQFWVLSLSPMLLMLVVWALARRHVLWKQALVLHTPSDVLWTPASTVIYPLICISAGVIAGLLGLGGGLVLGPLLLELGVDPASSAASTQVTLLISSCTAAIVYSVAGAVPWDYGAVLVALGFAATLAGLWAVAWLVARQQRPSVLVCVLAAMFSAAACAAAAAVVLAAIDLAHHPAKLTAHRGVCVAQR